MDHYDPNNPHQHFFASSVFGWGVGHDPMTAVKRCKVNSKGVKKVRGAIFHVPQSISNPYEIERYVPQVEGITKIYEGEL